MVNTRVNLLFVCFLNLGPSLQCEIISSGLERSVLEKALYWLVHVNLQYKVSGENHG